MYKEKNNIIDTKRETQDYENRYRMYAVSNPASSNIMNLDIFYKHNSPEEKPVMNLSMFNRFYKPFNDIEWNNMKNIEWLKDGDIDIEFLRERRDNDYHYRYYVDKGIYCVIEELKKIGFVPVIWKLPKYVDDIIELQQKEQTKEVKQKLSNCRKKMKMLYLAFTPLYIDENTLRNKGLAQISKYIMLHDIVYAVKTTGFTDLKQICKYLRKRQDVRLNRIATNRNEFVIDHHTSIETSYTTSYSSKVFPFSEVEHKKILYNFINNVWYIENADMPSSNNLMNNLYEVDKDFNSKIKNKILDRNKYISSYITDYKEQIVTIYLQNYYTIPLTKDRTNVIEIIFSLKNDIADSTSKNIESLYKALEDARKQNKTEGDFLYDYADKNGLDLRYRPSESYDSDLYFLLWLNRVPLFTRAEDLDKVKRIRHIKRSSKV